MKNFISGILLLIMSALVPVQAQKSVDLSKQLDQLLTAYEKVYGFSGTIKVVLKEKEVFEKSYGLANRSFDIPNTPATRNSINSISKTFTAVAALVLVKEGKLDLKAPVSKYLPNLQAPWKDKVTIHHLLVHSSGLPRESGLQPHQSLSLDEQVKLVEKQQLLFKPGAKYGYSNSGIILLGNVLEKAAGQDFADLIEQKVLQPLQLQNTGMYRGRNVVKKLAVPYQLGSRGLESQQRSKSYGENAGGGLYSTVGDLYKYVKALETNQLLPENLRSLLFKKHMQSGKNDFEGYAWSIKYFGPEKIHFAAGSGYGTKSVMIRMPASKDFVGIVSNWGNTPILNILRDVYLTMKGQKVDLPSSNQLASPKKYAAQIGKYEFDEAEIKQHLQSTEYLVPLQIFDDKLFFGNELLAQKANNKLGLTYTDEIMISFEKDKMILVINGNRLVGVKKN